MPKDTNSCWKKQTKKLQKAEPVVVGALHADARDEHPRETAEESQTEDT